MLNPFRYFAEQRDKDRETLLTALDRIFEAQNRQADVAIEQARSLRAFIDGYMQVTSAPIRRVYDDEQAAEAEQLQWTYHGES
jgi:hypothetical protein